jgi:hypothetical protein
MKHVKLFESWLNDHVYEAADVKPIEVSKAFPIDTEQWGSMEFVTGKKSTDIPGLATYLDQKLKTLTKNMPIKFKVVLNKKGGGNGTVEITADNNPNLKFITGGSLFKPNNAKSADLNPYGKTMFNYGGWIEDNGKEIPGDVQALDPEQGGDWRLGEFLSAAIQKKDIADISQTPKDFALNVALTYDSSKEGKPATIDNIVSRVSSGGAGPRLAPQEGGK